MRMKDESNEAAENGPSLVIRAKEDSDDILSDAGTDGVSHRNDIDLLKVIGCLFVVMYHAGVNSILAEASWPLCYYVGGLFSICVPIFFFASGCLYAQSAPKIEKRWRKAGKLILLSAVWGVITTAVLGVEQGREFCGGELVQCALGFTHGVTNHLWFLAAMAAALMVLPLILSVRAADEEMFRRIAWAAVIAVFGLDFFMRLASLFWWLTGIESALTLASFLAEFIPLQGNSGLALTYLLLGMLRGGEPHWGKKASLSIIALEPALHALYAIQFAQNEGTYDPVWDGFTFVGTAALVLALYSLAKEYAPHGMYGNAITLVGQNTIAAYLIHPMIIYSFIAAPLWLIEEWWIRALAEVALCIAVVLLASCVGKHAKRVPVLRWLFTT